MLFATIPFLNGGLFECLDKTLGTKEEPVYIRIDGFSDRDDNPLNVSNDLFFGSEKEVDLSQAYGDNKFKKARVRGLIHTFDHFKFTIEENTPIEEEIALDPELLGKVFENLLAAYNPETGATARKQTGSFYTPREIVNYMVDESLIAHLKTKIEDTFPRAPGAEKRLRHLLAYNEENHQSTPQEVEVLIAAIDRAKILDPACGSGAFPMGILHKLVFILGKLDPGNEHWKAKQVGKASEITDPTVREKALTDIEDAFTTNELDYGRKLYLIENCIYGVDIQAIAVQISKLRFFISLVVDQKVDREAENLGIRPLPNLETNFVAANTLIGINRPGQQILRNLEIKAKEEELRHVRERHFLARTPATKRKCREEDAQLRGEIAHLLKNDGWDIATARKLAAWDPYDQNASADFFDPEWMFGVNDGFDMTLGNPPYVRADSGEQHLSLRKAIEASGQYDTLWEKWDLYIPFIEKGYKVLKSGGVTTMIVSDVYCHSKYAQKSQSWFLNNSRILRLDFLSRLQIFDAAVHNIVYFFQKADGASNVPERWLHQTEFGNITVLPSDEQTKLTYRAFFPEDTAKQSFTCKTAPLESICYISYGLRPNSDENEAKGEFTTADVVSETRDRVHCRPYVEGKHLGPWLPITNLWIEWGTTRAPSRFCRPTFPELYAVPEKVLAQRSPGPDPVICFDDRHLVFTPASVGFVPWHALSGVRNNSLKKAARYRGEKPPRSDLPKREELEETSRRFDVKFLLGVMNSRAAHDFLRANRRSNIHLYPDDWKRVPIPDVSPEQQAPVIKLVNQLLAARKEDLKADVTTGRLGA
jgi:hypothetical protein